MSIVMSESGEKARIGPVPETEANGASQPAGREERSRSDAVADGRSPEIEEWREHMRRWLVR